MKKRIKLVFLTLCVATLFFSIQTNASIFKTDEDFREKTVNNLNRNETEYFALITGIEEYAGFDTPTQEYLDESAVAFYEKLVGSSNWKEENVKLLLNENATKDRIHDAIVGWLDEKENESDVVVIYHAGHGWKTSLKNRLHGNAYIFTHNSSEPGYDSDKITDKEYDDWLDQLDSTHIAVILENCYSGRWFSLRQFGRTILSAGGKYVFCPCNWSTYLQDTIFGHYLREGLDGVADVNNDGWITIREAYYYLRIPVFWHSLFYHFPYIWETSHGTMFVGPQIPYLYDRHVGSIPLIKI
ncbi:MAG: hypothetical protein V5A64_06645 [Candidatus Thermoplasmatota archaeon]